MGSVFSRGDSPFLRIKFKDSEGEWVQKPTKFTTEQRAEAEALLAAIERKIAEGVTDPAELGPETFCRYALKWSAARKAQGIATARDDESRLKKYVFPVIGGRPLHELRPRDLQELFRGLKRRCGPGDDQMAPRTVLHIYSTVKQCLHDAVADELIKVSPCVLKRHDLPKKQDKDPTWRKTAIFTRDEIAKLLTAGEIPEDRRMFWAVAFFTGLRFGEVAALRWSDYDDARQPLGHLSVARSYNTKTREVKSTKTEVARDVPVHPTLARALAEWRKLHWPALMLKTPGADDLIVPSRQGTYRSANHMLKKLHEDLERLDMPPRRQHDIRRTFISLSVEDGADERILKVIKHDPGQEAFDLYKSFSWPSMCAAMGALKMSLVDESVPLVRIWYGPEKLNQYMDKSGGVDGTRRQKIQHSKFNRMPSSAYFPAFLTSPLQTSAKKRRTTVVV